MQKRRFGWVLFVLSGVAMGSNSCSVSRTEASASSGGSGGSAAGNGGRAAGGKSAGGAAGATNNNTAGTGGALEIGGMLGMGGTVPMPGGEAGEAGAAGFGSGGVGGSGGEGGDGSVEPRVDCSANPCLNGGACKDLERGFSCTCALGYEGTRCEVNTDDCATNPCKNGGSCTDGVAAHSCQCKNGFKGNDCEVNIDDCVGNACKNGTCVDGVASYTCQCDSRHTGPACEFLEFKLAGSLFGTDPTRAIGMSGDGSVLLLQSSGENGENVARMVDFGFIDTVDLSQLKAVARYGESISYDGSVIVGQSLQGDTYLPFQLQLNSARTLYMGSLPAGSGSALDVSADGTTIVGYWSERDSGETHAFRSTSASVEYVGTLSGAESNQQATAVNGDGTIVAGTTFGSDALPSRSWRFNASTKTTQNVELLTGAWVNPSVTDMSRDGKVLVGSVKINGVPHAVRWVGDSAKAEDLGPGSLLATNADGSVSVGEDVSGNAAIWTSTLKAKPIASLIGDNPDLAGAQLFQASAVSDDGKIIAGTATVAGAKQGWVAHL